MATFYVGQRVRITGCINPGMSHHVGKEGRIIGKSAEDPDYWFVDCAQTTLLGNPCGWAGFRLEPILPEGHKASEYTYTELMDRLRSGVVA